MNTAEAIKTKAAVEPLIYHISLLFGHRCKVTVVITEGADPSMGQVYTNDDPERIVPQVEYLMPALIASAGTDRSSIVTSKP